MNNFKKYCEEQGYDPFYVNEVRQNLRSTNLKTENEKRREIREDNLKRLRAEKECFRDSKYNCN